MDLQSLVQNPLERGEIFFFVKDRCSQVTAIEGMVKTACFVGTGWSWHGYFPRMKETKVHGSCVSHHFVRY